MNPEDFEHRLRRQPPRQPPPEWRGEILRAARCGSSQVSPRAFWLSTLNHQLVILFWPSPKAWGVLAGAWMLVFAIQTSMRDGTLVARRDMAPPSQTTMAALAEQKRLMVELLGQTPLPDLAPDKRFLGPRSECREETMMT